MLSCFSFRSSQPVIRNPLCALLLCLIPLAGCGPTAGAWLHTLGMVPSQKVEAEFVLPKGPLLILVDDDQELIQPPLAKRRLVELLGEQLRENKVADRVTTNEELARIQQDEPKFDQRGAREVGRLAKADTVLWLSVKQFSVPDDLEIAVAPGTFSLMLKVIDATAEKREDVRLWPLDREGRLVSVTLTPNELHEAKTRTAVHDAMAAAMADKIARMFYEYKIEE